MSLAVGYEHAPAPDNETAQWWGRDRFLSYDAEGQPQICPDVIDITGQRRLLMWGPRVALERGLWRVTAIVELCPDAARRPLAVAFGADQDFTIAHIPKKRPDRHEIIVEHVLKAGDLAELRLYLVRAGFHGNVVFWGARVERIGDAE